MAGICSFKVSGKVRSNEVAVHATEHSSGIQKEKKIDVKPAEDGGDYGDHSVSLDVYSISIQLQMKLIGLWKIITTPLITRMSVDT